MSSSSSSTEEKPLGPLQVIVEEYSDSEDSSIPSSSSEEEDTRELPKTDIPPEYWHIQKLVKYLKIGNQTATLASLCCLKDHDLTTEINQLAIQDIGGLEVLINILETRDLRCKLGALSVLCELSQNTFVRRILADLGIITVLVKNLSDPARDLQILVAETIYNVAQIRKARKNVRKCDGIPKLVDLLDVNEKFLKKPWSELSSDEKEFVGIAKAAVRALWSVSESHKNVQVMMQSGAVPLLARLLRSVHIDVVVPTVGTIARSSSNPNYQIAVETQLMIPDVVKHLLAQEYPLLRRYCAGTIYMCGENATIRDQVRKAGGLDPLANMAKDLKTREDKPLLAAVTGAIWKTAITPKNVERYDQLKTVQILVNLLENVEEKSAVLSNVVGALSEMLKFEHNRASLRRAGGIPYLGKLLNYTYKPLLENVSNVLREAAKEDDSMRVIEELDGVRLIWSLLKNDSPKVQAAAAWALVPCVKNALDSGEMVRCFVGALELIVHLLKSTDTTVLASVCAAIAVIAQDRENLGIISDHGVVPMLVHLINTEVDLLREHLASAIAYCCEWGVNCKQFGRLGAITPLVRYMSSDNPKVHRTAALALYHLSKNPFNCITMHESGVVKFLLKTVASTDEQLQDASAGCLGNIRRLALEAETFHLITRGKPKKDDSNGD